MREDEIGERWPEIPDWADPSELDPEVRRDLRGLSKEGAEFVGAHLFMAGMLIDEDPALAWRHARAARSKGGRIAVVRETVGLVAYRAAEWAEAIAELRAARRMSGGPGQLPVMADCERALGHPEKAIEMSRSAEAADLDPASAAELRIVVAGARADLGQLDAALAHLEAAVESEKLEPFSARLFYAYADLLLQAERRPEAIDFFMKAAEADVDEETDAGDRLTELAGEATVEAHSDDRGAADHSSKYDAEYEQEDIAFDDEMGADVRTTGRLPMSATDPRDVPTPDADADAGDNADADADAGAGDDDVETNAAADLEQDLDDDDNEDEDREGTDDDTGSDDTEGDDDIDDAEGEDDDDTPTAAVDDADVDTPVRPAAPPSSMSSLFSHNEGGS